MARLDLEKRFSGSGSIRLKRAKDRIVSTRHEHNNNMRMGFG